MGAQAALHYRTARRFCARYSLPASGDSGTNDHGGGGEGCWPRLLPTTRRPVPPPGPGLDGRWLRRFFGSPFWSTSADHCSARQRSLCFPSCPQVPAGRVGRHVAIRTHEILTYRHCYHNPGLSLIAQQSANWDACKIGLCCLKSAKASQPGTILFPDLRHTGMEAMGGCDVLVWYP